MEGKRRDALVFTFHLRACGEHVRTHFSGECVCVSPPRLRRTSCGRTCNRGDYRFTSAPAENIPRRSGVRVLRPFHLRACGEHADTMAPWFNPSVSPPRLRRTLRGGRHQAGGRRFTSAPAENIPPAGWYADPSGFHLRACGEHINPMLARLRTVVSPPRLRRTFRHRRVDLRRSRFTSAPAENIATRIRLTRPSPFHLRACGEHELGTAWVTLAIVSPPRLRRTFRHTRATAWTTRFTSAPAENIA